MDSGTIVLKPASSSAIVRFPGTPKRILKAEGEQVVRNAFWDRRIKGGDVVVVYNNNNNKQEETK